MNMQVEHSMILCEKMKNCNNLLAPAHPQLWRSSGHGGEGDSFGFQGVCGCDGNTILEKRSIDIQPLRRDEACND